jgi:hypothetical protein
MKTFLATLCAVLLGTVAVYAADSPGASGNSPGHQMLNEGGPSGPSSTPGHQMQNNPNDTGPGASDYAPGQQSNDGSSSPGASGYAPGQGKGSTMD